MTYEELIEAGKHQVRHNKDLMLSYIKEFKRIFGKEPNCAPCTFKQDWELFASKSKTSKKNTMGYQVKRKFKDQIFRVKVGRSILRSYGRNMSDEFAKKYIENGGDVSIFENLPKEVSDDLESMSRKKLNELAKSLGIFEPEKLGRKSNVVEAIRNAR